LIVAAGLLKNGGRMAFVVPAEIGHAGYARTLLPALCDHFNRVQIVACREKIFPRLSEDCWLLYCEGFGGRTDHMLLSVLERFSEMDKPPRATLRISLAEWRAAGERLRPFLLSPSALSLYRALTETPQVRRFGELATANIGYVSGANDFFHLRPKDAKQRRFPEKYLRVTVRNTAQLPSETVNNDTVRRWIAADEPVLLLDLKNAGRLPREVAAYLDEEPGQKARHTYKCRNRDPWYVVPDIKSPDGFLSVMSGGHPSLVRNDAGCVCTNSLHAVNARPGASFDMLERGWTSRLAVLGTELEGHPLGGGMLKLEPREAARIPLPVKELKLSKSDDQTLAEATRDMRLWRHHA
jgi:adenine-specific DNA-methyltransferase